MVVTAGCGSAWFWFGTPMRNVAGTSICATTTMTRPRCIVVCTVVLRSCSCCCHWRSVVVAITLYCCNLFFVLFLLFLLLSVVCSHRLCRRSFIVRRVIMCLSLSFPSCCYHGVLLFRVVSRCFALLFLFLSMWLLCS